MSESDLLGESELWCGLLITIRQAVILLVSECVLKEWMSACFPTNTCINTVSSIYHLEQPCIPERLSRKREEFLNSSCLLPHHELLSGRGEVQGGDNVRVVRQLGPDGLTVQLLHAVHNQLPLTLRLGLFHWVE